MRRKEGVRGEEGNGKGSKDERTKSPVRKQGVYEPGENGNRRGEERRGPLFGIEMDE